MAKSKKKSEKKVRSLNRKLLEAIRRNIDFISSYLDAGGKHTPAEEESLKTILELYAQQKKMFDEKTHRVDNRIVGIQQPYIRPIVRGKTKAPVEFGTKYDVSIDEKGHARLEKLSFDPYNECNVLPDALEKYKERTGHYPKRVLVDQIYRTKSNRAFCEERGIKMSGRKPGRPPKNDAAERQVEKRNDRGRNEVERFFNREKRTCGAALIVTRLSETTLTSIALSVFVANLSAVPHDKTFFVVYFADVSGMPGTSYFCDFLDNAS